MLCIVLANLALVNCHPLFGFNTINKWINSDALKPASFDDEVSDYQVEFEERNETKKSGDLKWMANNSSDSNNETLEIFSLMTSTASPVNVSTTTTTMSTTSSSTTYMPSSNSTETSTRTTLQPSVTTLASTSTSTMDPKKLADFFLPDDEPIAPDAFNFSADGLTTSHPSTTQMPSTSMRPSTTMFSATSAPSTRHQTGPAVTTPTTTSPNNTTPINQVNININSAGKASSGAGAFRVSALAGILIVFTSCRLF